MKSRIQILAAVLAFFFKKFPTLSAPNGYETEDRTIYLNSDVKGKGGTIDLVDGTTKKIDGVTNLDGNKLDAGRYLVVDSIRALVEDTELTFATAKWDSPAVAELKNASLKIYQGKDILEIPMTDILNGNTPMSNSDDFREISHLPTIKPDEIFKIQLVFPNAVPGAVTACLVRLEFRCTEVYIK